MPIQLADTANSPIWHSMHIFVKVKCFHLGNVSKENIEFYLWNLLIDSTDQNAEYTPVADVHTVAKFFATFPSLKKP